MRAIIIAGGFGTRLRPLTYNTPKSMVPVANIPFVIHQVSLIKKYGIKEIILNLHYLSDNIKKIFEDEQKHGVKIYYSIEESPLGTAGAVKNAEQYFDSDPLLIFNGDILTDIDLSELLKFHRKKKATATLTLTKVEDPTTYGLVITDGDGRIKRFIEKPSWERVTTNTISAGIYVVDPKVFSRVPANKPHSFERELFPSLLESGEAFYAFESDAYWIDIGNPSKYMQAHRAILEREVAVHIPGRETSKGIWVGSGTEVDEEAKIFGPAIVGERCKIMADAKVDGFTVIGNNVTLGEKALASNSVVLDGTKIGNEAILRNCIVGFDCRIEEGAEVSGGVVLADGTVIKKGSRIGTKL
jgi:mannose-1-phosphate guanylyltransferase/phosphomannomutase